MALHGAACAHSPLPHALLLPLPTPAPTPRAAGAGLPAMTSWKPYLLKVFLSNRYVYASILHKAHPQDSGHFVASASSLERGVRQALSAAGQSKADQEAARQIGTLLAQKAQRMSLESVHFERKHKQRYTGKLKVLIEAARAAGLRVE